MALFSEEFAGWLDSDFAAFQPAKWRSNRFTPERTRVRLRLAAALEQSAALAGLGTAGLHLWTSRLEPALTNQHEVRSLTVAWTRPGAEDVAASEPFVGLHVTEADVALQLRIPAGQSGAWQTMAATLAELANLTGMRVRLDGAETTADALIDATTPGDLLLERVMSRVDAVGGLLTVDELAAWSGVVLPLLADVLGKTLDAVAPPESQAPDVVETPQAGEAAQDLESPAEPEVATSPVSVGREPPPRRGYRPQWASASSSTPAATRTEAPRPPIERIMPPTWRPEPPAPRPAPPPVRPSGPRYPNQRTWADQPRNDTPRPDMRRPGPDRSDTPMPARGRPFELGPSHDKPAATPTVLGPGAKVQLQKGLFSGKLGTVTALAGDSAQVLLGLMTVRVPTADLRLV